jgi:hypothetical protein
MNGNRRLPEKGAFLRKIFLLTLVMLTAAVCLQAQDAGMSSGAMTIQGCLSYSSHHYMLTDSSGKQHQLSGYATKLKPHVGHEIEVTGTEGTHTVGTTQEGMASTAHEVPVFKVTSMKHIAATCTTGK